jgi:hypothetical protein
MALPLVIDIAIGLIFIYLILSLLASEIQELIATLLQWRAEHLKKSIDVLFSGENATNSLYQKFTDELYHNPLIQSLNQEAKGRIAHFFRRIVQTIGDIYRTVTRTKNIFGDQRSAPSYIPSETFSTALLQKLNIEALSNKLSEWTIRKFGEEKLALIQEILDALRYSIADDTLLENEFTALRRSLSNIIDDFVRGRISLVNAVDLATQQLTQFVDNIEASLSDNHHCQTIIRQRLPYLRQALQLQTLEPTITEVLSLIIDQRNLRDLPPEIATMVARTQQQLADLPDQLKRNLRSLAEHAQTKADSLEDGVRQLDREVAAWFDRSMDRASGVYRRNAKGVGIIIGFLIATATNSDTFHMVGRLSRDSAIRSTITAAANQAAMQNTSAIATSQPSDTTVYIPPDDSVEPESAITPDEPDAILAPDATSPATSPAPGGATAISAANLQSGLEEVRDAVDTVLEELPLPIGWNQVNLEQQALEGRGWGIPFLKRLIGWLITGIALSMGASFWYDLLGKIVRVRNTGTPNRSDDRPN